MVPSHQSNKATPYSDSNGHSQHDTTTITSQSPQLASQQKQQDFNEPLSLEQDAKNLVTDEQQSVEHQQVPRRRWGKLSLKTKATALAIALSTLPVIVIGAGNYYFSSQDVKQDAISAQENLAVSLADRVGSFMFERYGDIQVFSNLPILRNPKVRAVTTLQEKQAVLDRFLELYSSTYDSIAVADLAGNTIMQSSGEPVTDIGKQDYFQEVIKTKRPVITPPTKSALTGEYSVFVAAPIVDTTTGKIIGIVRSRLPGKNLDKIIRQTEETNFSEGSEDTTTVRSGVEFHLIDGDGKLFAASEKNQVLGEDFRSAIPVFAQMQAGEKVNSREGFDKSDPDKLLITYAPVKQAAGMPQLNWSILIHKDAATVFATQRNLLLTVLFGTAVTALLVGAIAAYLADRATRPILAASSAVEKLGQGELDTRIAVAGEDEFATLGSNINQMAAQLQTALEKQEAETKRAQLLKDITIHISQSVNLQDVFNTAVQEIRLALKTDRVVVYSFNDKWQGTVTAESVADGWPIALGAQIDDPCFADRYVERYRGGRVQPTANIYEANLNSCHIKQLEQFAVKANLVAPIVQGNQLFGLLIAHQCESPRAWQQSEIDLFSQLATQVGLALDRASLLEQQKTAKEQLQKRALELLMEVDPVSRGDLTIRANVTEDEIGTVADSYNATIGNLRKIVTQVQAAAEQVATTTTSSKDSVQELSAEALRQTEEISDALDRIQEMSNSIRAVAKSAEQAKAAVLQANQTVEAGDAAMNRTVEGILAIRETVTEASTKVKRLGETSQKISKVVNLIGSFADQTNLLALNAAIEAARAGEEGRGFAVVADEVGLLALKSAQATAEIESLVSEIQTETNEVVAAMETGTLQVTQGTKLVDETRQSLNQITAVSAQIGALVQAIAQATVAQTLASDEVSQSMSGVAAIASQTSKEATVVSMSFKELLEVAQDLQASAGRFKVT